MVLIEDMDRKITLNQWTIFFICRNIRVLGTQILSQSQSQTDSADKSRKFITGNIIKRISQNELIDDNLRIIVLIGDCVKNKAIPDFFHDTYKNGFPVLWKKCIFLWKIYSVTKNEECFEIALSKQKSQEMQISNKNTSICPIENSTDLNNSNDQIVFELNFECSKAKTTQKLLSNSKQDNSNNCFNTSTPIKRSNEVSVLGGRTNAKLQTTRTKNKSGEIQSKSKRNVSTMLSKSHDDSSSDSNDKSDSNTSSDESEPETTSTRRKSTRKIENKKSLVKKKTIKKGGGSGGSGKNKSERKENRIVPVENLSLKENNDSRKTQRKKAQKQTKNKKQITGKNKRGDSSPQKALIDGVNSTLKKLTKKARKQQADSTDTNTDSTLTVNDADADNDTVITTTTDSAIKKTKTKEMTKKAVDSNKSEASVNDNEVFKKPLHPAPRNSVSVNNTTTSSGNNWTLTKKRKYSESNSDCSQNTTTSQRKRKLHTMGSNSQIMLG